MILDEIPHPIVLAPLAGGPSTPGLAAAVSEAGGLGCLAAGYLAPDAFRARLRETRALTGAPIGVNLFAYGRPEVDEAALRRFLERLRPEAERHGVGLGEARFDDDALDEKLAILADEPVAVVSFTFGPPPPGAIAALRDRGSEVWVTVTSVPEARSARDAGADALVLQGAEAGGHRGAWEDRDGEEDLGLLALLRLVAREVELPLVAAGGIGDGAGVAAVLAAGAAAAQVGTAFLRAPEAGTTPAHADALATEAPTAITRAFSGRRARGLVNRFLLDHGPHAPAAYPHVRHATAPLRAEARRAGDPDGFNLWAGQAHRLAEARPAGEIVASLARDARAAIAGTAARLGGAGTRRGGE